MPISTPARFNLYLRSCLSSGARTSCSSARSLPRIWPVSAWPIRTRYPSARWPSSWPAISTTISWCCARGTGSRFSRAPRRGRRLDRSGEVEVNLEMTAGAPQDVGEALAGHDLHAPDVGRGLSAVVLDEELLRVLVHGEKLDCRGAGRIGVAAVQRDLVLATILVAMVVLQLDAGPGPGQ